MKLAILLSVALYAAHCWQDYGFIDDAVRLEAAAVDVRAGSTHTGRANHGAPIRAGPVLKNPRTPDACGGPKPRPFGRRMDWSTNNLRPRRLRMAGPFIYIRTLHMTKLDFALACEIRGIDPMVALENDKIRAALEARDDALVVKLLDEEF